VAPRLLLLALLPVVALALCGTPASAVTVPSVVLEDGSSLTLSNDTITINAALGGAHAGQVFVANGSSLTLYNVTLTFGNTSDDGGIFVEGSATLTVVASWMGASPIATFGVTLSSSATLQLQGSNLSALQIVSDLGAAAILLRSGAELHAADSSLRAYPDLRPLLDADASTIDFLRCELGGSIVAARSTVSFVAVSLSVLGDSTALNADGSVALIDNSTISASGGASGLAAAGAADVTVRSSNITAEDLGVSAVGSSSVHLDDVIIVGAAFGLVGDSGVLVGSNVGVYGSATSLWLRGSTAVLGSVLLGSGIIRLSGSTATLAISGPLLAPTFLDAASTLRLVDATFDWARFSLSGASALVPSYTPQFRFHEAGGGALAADVNWTVYTSSGGLVERGISRSDGLSQGPPLEGPAFDGRNFTQAPSYRVEYGRGSSTFNSTTSAWGLLLVFDFYLDASIEDVGFSPEGLLLSDRSPSIGSTINVSAFVGLVEGTTTPSFDVAFYLDGREVGRMGMQLNGIGWTNASFPIRVDVGTHLISIEADLPGAGGRGALSERSELANNFVAIWFNATANQTVSVKPDLVVSSLAYEYLNDTVLDTVTGEAVTARVVVVYVNLTNRGLTDAGPFEIAVIAGTNYTRVRVGGIAAGGSTVANVRFGPYQRSQEIPIRAQVDVDNDVEEGDEINNVADGTAFVVIPPLQPPQRPLWATVLVVGAAVAIVGLSLWGVRSVFRPDETDSLEGPPKEKASAPSPAAPAAATPTVGQASPPPGGPPAPPSPSVPTAGPPVQAPPAGYPPMPYYAPPYPGSMGAPAGTGPGPATSPPPAKCPQCGSAQISYVFYPARQVVCSSCRNTTPF
jgi:hypothetical protein